MGLTIPKASAVDAVGALPHCALQFVAVSLQQRSRSVALGRPLRRNPAIVMAPGEVI